MMIHVRIGYVTCLWVLYVVWATPGRGGSPHRPKYDLQLHPRHAQLFCCLLEDQELEPWTLLDVKWSNDGDKGMDVICHCYMSVIWDMDHVWQGWLATQTTSWSGTTPQTYSATTLGFVTKSLQHRPHQWCSCLGMMIPIWTYHPTDLWVWYVACITSNRVGSLHKQ